MVEQGTENPRVGGSTPSPATPFLLALLASTALWVSACGDRCEQLCQQTANRIAACKPESLTWFDLGARSRSDFVDSCRDEWDRLSADLTANDLRLALDLCDETAEELGQLTCEEVLALYAGRE